MDCRGRDESRKNRGGLERSVLCLWIVLAPCSTAFVAPHCPWREPELLSLMFKAPATRAGLLPPAPVSPSQPRWTRIPHCSVSCASSSCWSLGQEHSSCPSFVRRLTDGSAPPTPANSQLGFRKARGGEEVLIPRCGVGWWAQTLSPPLHIHPRALPAKSRIGR